VKAIESIGYTNVGTIEFLLDAEGSLLLHGDETRALQVEHPVTRARHRDRYLVREQIRIAAGEPLSFNGDRRPRGHAISKLRGQRRGSEPNFAPWPGKDSPRCTCRGGPWCACRYATWYAGYVVAAEITTRCSPKGHRPRHGIAGPQFVERSGCLEEMVIEGTTGPTSRSCDGIINHPEFIRGGLRYRFSWGDYFAEASVSRLTQ